MAATPEYFLADAEQLSPSLFLDLSPPPTPMPASQSSSDENLHLDFISRMLMEEDIHDRFFYQYPDHPAILAAQRPFAQIISDSIFSSDDSTAGNSNSVATAGQNSGISNGKSVEEKLIKPLVLNNGTVKESKHKPAIFPSGDFFNGQTDSDMAMLHMAFRKGMEEANKFLPTNNTLLDKPVPMMFGNGRGGRKKKRHDDMEDLEAETGRNSKLMTWEQEEIGAREMVDKIMLRGFENCMKDLRITMGSDTEKKNRKGTSDEVVDLRAMLIHCAQAVASGDRRGSNELLGQIKQHSSPKGHATAMQRLAYCFAEGLEARLAGTGSQVYRSLVARRTSLMQYLKTYKLMAANSHHEVKLAFMGRTIVDAMEGKSRLHIVDYNVHYGFQWPSLLKSLATREGGPPEVRITGIDLPQPGFRPDFQIEETGRRLTNCAHEFGLQFKFHGIAAKLETVCVEDLHIDPDEVLVVTSRRGFSTLMDESVVTDNDNPSPRDMILNNIQKMRPDVFIEFIVNGTYSMPYFVTRFREALFFYSTQFDIMDATIPRDSDERRLIERDIFGRGALNVIACEGADRVDRPETYKQRQVRSHRAGLRQLPLNPEVVKVVMDKAKNYHKEFVIDVDKRWLLLGWKGRVLYAMSTWVAA